VKHRGFTLIETIYSTLLFGFIIITLVNLYPSSFLAIKRGEGTLVGDALAQATLEELRSKPFDTYAPEMVLNPGPSPWIYGGTTYTPTVEVFWPPGTAPSPGFLKGYRVTVKWRVGSHTAADQTRQVTHEMYVHNVRR